MSNNTASLCLTRQTYGFKILDAVSSYGDDVLCRLSSVCRSWNGHLKKEVSQRKFLVRVLDTRAPAGAKGVLPFAVQMNILSYVDFGRVPLRRDCAYKHPCKRNGMYPFSREFITVYFERNLLEAHQITEQLYALHRMTKSLNFSCYKNALRQRKGCLLGRVEQLVGGIYETSKNGPQALRECVNSGCFLKALRVFYFCCPKALENHGDGYNDSILHYAVAPIRFNISPRFVAFVLDIDKQYQLGLTRIRDWQGDTPLQSRRDAVGCFKPVVIKRQKAVEQLLLQYENGPTQTTSNSLILVAPQQQQQAPVQIDEETASYVGTALEAIASFLNTFRLPLSLKS